MSSTTKIAHLVKSVNRSRALARCFEIEPPDFHYISGNMKYDIEKYNEDMHKIINFNHL